MIYIILIVILILLIFIFLIKRKQKIPKIIYTFWHEKELPLIVKKCIESWKKNCPDYEIKILSYEDTKIYRHSSDSHQRHSDFVRLDCLYETGGIWIDASVFLNKPIDDWINKYVNCDLIGYYIDDNQTRDEWPSIETWFMAVPKNSRIIKDWREEFMKYNNYETPEEYIKNEMNGIELDNLTDLYLLIYISQQKCIQKYGDHYNLNLIDVKKDAFLHLNENNFNIEQAVKQFCNGVYKDKTRMIKLRRCDRPYAEKYFDIIK